MFPIFIPINTEDIPDIYFSFKGTTHLFVLMAIAMVFLVPLTYYVIGSYTSFDAWGLHGVSFFIGTILSSLIAFITSLIFDM